MSKSPANRLDAVSQIPSASNEAPRKLGLVPGIPTALLNDRYGVAEAIGDLPEGVALCPRVTLQTRLALFVAITPAELTHSFEQAQTALSNSASFWIIYPRQSAPSGHPRAFDGDQVREMGVAAGFVDYKIAAIHPDWSATKFTTKKNSWEEESPQKKRGAEIPRPSFTTQRLRKTIRPYARPAADLVRGQPLASSGPYPYPPLRSWRPSDGRVQHLSQNPCCASSTLASCHDSGSPSRSQRMDSVHPPCCQDSRSTGC